MADLVLGVAKLLVEGTLSKARSVIEEETKLRESAQRDLVFITGEFQMMQSFLNVTSKEHIKINTVSTWVTQVRDLAYDVEDCIEFVIHLDMESACCRRCFFPIIPACIAGPQPLDEAVANIQQLKARVEDVSQRSARYNLVTDSNSNPIMEMKQPAATSAAAVAVLGMLAEAKDKQHHLKDLTEFLNKEDSSLQVISVWARGRELETASIIRKVYDDPTICRKFQCRAWVKLMHPFNPREFIQSLLSQFYSQKEKQVAIRGTDVLNRIKAATAAEYHLVQDFTRQLNNQTYLIVVDDLSTMVEWDTIRAYLPDRKNGSRIIVSTQHFEIASFCTGHPYLHRSTDDHSPCVFFKTVSEGGGETGVTDGTTTISQKKEVTLARMKHSTLCGRDSQIVELQKYLMKARVSHFNVISVWGTNGVGKSASVRDLYYQRLHDENQLFDKYGWVDVSHPFSVRDFSRALLGELNSYALKASADAMEECRKILKKDRCLVVIDGLNSTGEWDMIQAALVPGSNSIIVVITTQVSIALHCTGREEFVFNIKCLEHDAAFDLLQKEVLMENPRSTINNVSDSLELRKLISRCGGLPKVIVATSRLLATSADKWESIASSMNAQFMHYLETKQELDDLFVWMHSYFRALPDDLRQSISYLSLFPGHCTIRRRRMVMRWVAEGYSKDDDSYTAGENGEKLFAKLVEVSMIQPPKLTSTGLVSFQVSEFFREYIISRPVEENIAIALEIFALKGHCHPTTQRRGRHLVIEESWRRDRIVYENIDFSRLRSLTVLGKWEPFLVSRSMKVLRVLDLEDSSGVTDKDVDKMLELLPRLKFLSLRGCTEVTHLPSSLGDLRQLQILDVRSTSIVSMPASIAKLKKLQYIRAGPTAPTPTEHPSTPCALVSSWLSKLFGLRQPAGVRMPTGIGKMTLLHTLGVVNVDVVGGKAMLKEVRNLTHLRKLGVSGISKRNSKEFCSAISCHAHLESLSVWLGKGRQDCCLDDISSPLENLQSLKLYGLQKDLPAWITYLPKLTKLDLDMTISATTSEGIIAVLGDMKELHTLRLCVRSSLSQDGGDIMLDFCVKLNGVEMQSYMKVKVLHIACSSRLCITFGLEAMQNLELLVVGCCSESDLQFKELKRLSKHKLKEAQLLVSSDNTLKGFNTLKKNLEALKNDLKAEALKNMDSELKLEAIQLQPRASRNNTLKDLETLKKDLETLQKNLHFQLKLKEVRLLGSGNNTIRDIEILKKDLETLKKDLETLKKNLHFQLKLIEVQLLGSGNNILRDNETLEKDLEVLKNDLEVRTLKKDLEVETLKKDLETLTKKLETLKKELETLKKKLEMPKKTLKMKLEMLKEKLSKLEALENNLETLKKNSIETLKKNFEEQLMEHPMNPAVNLEYLD